MNERVALLAKEIGRKVMLQLGYYSEHYHDILV